MTLPMATAAAIAAMAPLILRLADFLDTQAALIRSGHGAEVAARLQSQAQLIRRDWAQ